MEAHDCLGDPEEGEVHHGRQEAGEEKLLSAQHVGRLHALQDAQT